MMPGDLYRYKHRITHCYGRHVYNIAKQLVKVEQRMALAKNQLVFLERCVEHRITPNKLHDLGHEEHGGNEMTRLCLGRDKTKEKYHDCIGETQKLKRRLTSILSDRDMRDIAYVMQRANKDMYETTKTIYTEKFRRLKQEKEEEGVARHQNDIQGGYLPHGCNNLTLVFNRSGLASVSSKSTEPDVPRIPLKDMISSLKFPPESQFLSFMCCNEDGTCNNNVHDPNITSQLSDVHRSVMCATLGWVWKGLHRGNDTSVVDVVREFRRRLSVNRVVDRRSKEVKRKEWEGLVTKLKDFMLLYSTDTCHLDTFDGQAAHSYLNNTPP